MIDLSTLLVAAAIADLALAAALWLGASRRLRDGLSHWAASLVLRALGLGLLAGAVPAGPGILALGAALAALSATLQAAALLAAQGRSLPAWVHSAVLAAVAIPVQLLEGSREPALLFGGVMFGTLLAATAAIASRIRPMAGSRARGILVASFAVAAAALALRGIGAMLSVEVRGPAMGLAAAAPLAAFAATLAATFAFLLLHKERAEAEAVRLSTLDPLTGACNRRTFHEVAEREMARARRAGQPLSIILVDIDHFREVNKAHGQRGGDVLLQRFAEVVRGALRKEDVLVRYGGEEFLVMLPGVPGPGAVVVAGRIRRSVAAEPLEAGEARVAVTASLGVAARLDEGPESLDGLLARADAALALAKERGRNRVVALSLGRSIAA